jgi:hypothetical protein
MQAIPYLVGRADVLEQVRAHLAKRPGDLQVVGGPGVGKTTMLRALLAELSAAGNDCIAVTCTPTMRPAAILLQILRAYTPSYPLAGFSQNAMATDLERLLQARGRPVIVLLDSHDALRDGKKALDILRALQAPVRLVLARRTPLGDSDLQTVTIPAYTKAQAREVLVRHAAVPLSAGVLDLLAATAAKDGMTRALAALAAIRGPVGKGEAIRIIQSAHDRFNQPALCRLTDHHLFILQALAQQTGPMRSRHLRHAYTAVANANKEKARANVQFLKYVDQLARGGFVDVKPLRGNGMPGGALAVTMRCPPEVARREVEAALLRRAS